jgi:hypothetical protein
MFDLLVNSGASCHSVVNNEKNTLLHCFCFNQTNDAQTSLFKKLINKGCDINAENNNRYTPLMLAAKLDMINTCQILLTAHADMFKTDKKGCQAIDLAKPNGQCFEFLRQATYIEQNKSHPDHIIDRINWEKQRSSSKSTNHVNTNENKSKWYLSNSRNEINLSIYDADRDQEIHAKYKHLWKKLLQAGRAGEASLLNECNITIRL